MVMKKRKRINVFTVLTLHFPDLCYYYQPCYLYYDVHYYYYHCKSVISVIEAEHCIYTQEESFDLPLQKLKKTVMLVVKITIKMNWHNVLYFCFVIICIVFWQLCVESIYVKMLSSLLYLTCSSVHDAPMLNSSLTFFVKVFIWLKYFCTYKYKEVSKQ